MKLPLRALDGWRSTAPGPLPTFALARVCIAPAGDGGCPPPRMSSALGCAQGSPLISLRRAPAVPISHNLSHASANVCNGRQAEDCFGSAASRNAAA